MRRLTLPLPSLPRSRIIVATMLVTLALFAAAVPSLQAATQAPVTQWSKIYGAGHGNSVIQTADGGYAIAGNAGSQAVLVKTNSSGGLQWLQLYGNEVFGGDNNIVSLVQTRDLGYVLFGEGGYIAKADSEGSIQSVKALNVSGVKAGIQTIYGDYVLVGNMIAGGNNVTWIVKTDEEGNMLWDKEYTGGYTVYAVIEGYEGGYALAGSYKENFWFAKLDSNGNPQWDRQYSYGGLEDLHHATSIARTSDGGFVLAGIGDWQASGGEVPWLIKTDFGGNQQWYQVYVNMHSDGFVSVVETEDGGYVAAQRSSATLVKTDDLGVVQWVATYGEGGSYNYPSSLILTMDGGFALAGESSENNGSIWLIKTSSENAYLATISISSPESKTYTTSEIPLVFRVSKPTSRIAYSLDEQDNVTISGNTTLTGLSEGAHSITIYVLDTAGYYSASETIYFNVTTPLPVVWIATFTVIGIVVVVGVLVYFKKLSLTKQNLVKMMNNRMVRGLTIMGLCILMILFQLFFPYFFYSVSSGTPNSPFQVGVTYVYEQDNIGQIYSEVSRIHALGFEVIRVNLVCDVSDPNAYPNVLTEEFFMSTQHFNMSVALIINNDVELNDLSYYLGRWGSFLSYIQVLNEPELSASWAIGALYTDDELFSKFQDVYALVEPYRATAQLYTNFEAGYLLRTNVPLELSERLDFVGFDVFMESFLILSPDFIQFLHKTTNKDVVITEYGMSTNNEAAQSDFIIQGLNLFKSMGLKGCWIVYWNSVNNNYGIRGRLAEKTIGEWIAENANSS
jgi:hypothetical protein